jgi:hypothetical protein
MALRHELLDLLVGERLLLLGDDERGVKTIIRGVTQKALIA